MRKIKCKWELSLVFQTKTRYGNTFFTNENVMVLNKDR